EDEIERSFFFVELLNEIVRNWNIYSLAIAFNRVICVAGQQRFRFDKFFEIVKGAAVDSDNFITRLKSDCFSYRADLETTVFVNEILHQVGIAVGIRDPDKNEYSDNNVNEDSAKHNNQSLPGRLRTKLPGLWRLLHSFRVERFIDHP